MPRWLLVFAVALILAGCAPSSSLATPTIGSSVTGATLQRAEGGRLEYFQVDVEKDGDPVGLDFRGRVD